MNNLSGNTTMLRARVFFLASDSCWRGHNLPLANTKVIKRDFEHLESFTARM